MVTIREIAEIAGVSRGTVDRVLNNRSGVSSETYKKVKDIADSLGYEPNMAGQMLAARKRKIKLGFIICYSPVDVFFSDVYLAAQKKAKELKTYGVTVKFYLIKELSDRFITGLLKNVEEDELDGIALVPLNMDSIVAFVERMDEQGVPIVFLNLDLKGTRRLSYVGCDYYISGKVAAGLIALATREKGQIALATSFDEKSPALKQRLSGFVEELDREYPDIEIVNKDCNFVFQKGSYQNILDVINKYPELRAVYLVNPGDYSICEEIAKLDRKMNVKIITNDVMREQKEWMDNGVIVATIGQQPEKQGALPLQILYDYLALGQMPQDKYLTELSIYIKQNISLDKH